MAPVQRFGSSATDGYAIDKIAFNHFRRACDALS
jgi:hypothetical protein